MKEKKETGCETAFIREPFLWLPLYCTLQRPNHAKALKGNIAFTLYSRKDKELGKA